jgi:CRISPR-associated protein Cas5h
MTKQAIKFKLSGDYALFKKPFANNQPQSFVIPPKTVVLGIIGAIMGWSKSEYITNLPFDKFYYAVRLLTPKIKKDLIGINLMQGKNADFNFTNPFLKLPKGRKKGEFLPPRYRARFEFLKDMEWEIFLIIEDNNIQKELFERLQTKRFVYNPYLGLQSLFAKIENEKLLNIKLVDEVSDNVYSSFEKNFIKFKIKKPITFYNELIPVSFDKDRSLPKTKEMISFVGDYSIEILNKEELVGKLYQDDDKRLYQFI